QPAEQSVEGHLAERARFEGTWRVLRAEFARQRLPLDKLPVSITADRWTMAEPPATDRITLYTIDAAKGLKAKARRSVIVFDPIISYTFDATRYPKTIDLTFPGGQRAQGIYEFQGDLM